ncbi:MAG: hypothetical protein Q8882_03415 [Bacillota bacterium]|nr:hypothetical protein [Bacillota bacterium]
MKKHMCILLILCMILSLFTVSFAVDKKALTCADIAYNGGVNVTSSGMTGWGKKGQYIGFKGIDMSGIKNVKIAAKNIMTGGANGEAFRIYIDDPVKGTLLGYVLLTLEGERVFSGNINEASGVHDLYIVSTLCKSSNLITITSVTLNGEHDSSIDYAPILDSALIDDYSDTWAAVDDMGRSVADYEETGDVKGDRYVGMMYWNWHVNPAENARIPSQIIAAHPESKDDYYSPAWDVKGNYYWSEPLFGYYTSYDYWVYRKQAEMFDASGIDALFFDWSNGDSCFVKGLMVMCQAFTDAKKEGVKVPRLSCLSSWSSNFTDRIRCLETIYINFIKEGRYRDLWFDWNGKPLVFGGSTSKTITDNYIDRNDPYEVNTMKEIFNTFAFRTMGSRQNGPKSDKSEEWMWLENYPQHLWGKEDSGKTEFVVVGTAINHSYVYQYGAVGVFSDKYTKGRSYTEAFGEDYRENAYNEGYFFKEQASRALDIDPHFIMIDGWNEWTAGRNTTYSGIPNSFVDTFDDENSRDFEPSNGVLKDNYFNLLVDFIRKYKGVRPARLASEEKTIDINGNLSQWDNVGPEYINLKSDYERDTDGSMNGDTGKPYHYTTKLNNVIVKSKVARDDKNFYFYVETAEDIKEGTNSFLHMYINTDRNHATGWEGYDYAVNRTLGTIEKNTGGFNWEKASDITYKIKGKVMILAIPRSAISSSDKANFEFKWTDGADEEGNILRFYSYGSVAPFGRFNYVYTEVQQKVLSKEQKAALKDTTIIGADKNRMVVSGGKMYVYEKDTRVTPKLIDGVLYFPVSVLEEALGYGETKYEYYSKDNMLFVRNHDLKDSQITDYKWAYTTIGSYEVRINGKLSKLENPVKIVDGLIYVPITYAKDCFEYSIYDVGNGQFAFAKNTVDTKTVDSVLSSIQ